MKPLRVTFHVSAVAVAFCVHLATANAGDWPHWRGPGYDGKSDEKGFKSKWDGGLEPAWQAKIGSGYSGITVVGGHAFTCGVADGGQVVYCFDTQSGSMVWKSRLEDNFKDMTGWGDGPRSTPTIEGGRVYVLGALGTLSCLDAASGKSNWTKKFDAKPMWGYSGSVLIEGDLAVVTVGGEGGGMRAVKKETGEDVWRVGGDEDSGYSTPYPFTFDGKRYVIGFMGNSAVVAEIKTGKEVLTIPWETSWKVNAATPIFHDGRLFLSSGYSTGAGLFKLSKKGDRLETEEIYRTKKLKNKFQTPVLVDGYLYTCDERSFKCADFKTGELKWEERGNEYKHGSVLFADGKLILLTQLGELKIGEASPEGFKATGTTTVFPQTGAKNEQCWTVSTLAYGRLFLRNLDKLVCLDLRG
ncbi:MAG: PQQ-like beta-propeller repeat protein [Phycisphaerales bacterium]|nr:PQQ-like beta-propeller repeat protein [Phycisphaerales bacterium]